MIKKPRREDQPNRPKALLVDIIVILGLILIPFMSKIPLKIRMTILGGIYRILGSAIK